MVTSSELDERIDKCQRILDADPNSQIFAALAEAYRKKGDLDLAFKVCKNGLKVHDNYGSAHVVMAKINLDRGLYDWAEIEAKRAADLDGSTRTIELLLAEIYIYKGEFQPAIRLLKKLHSRDPENPQIQKLLEIAQKIPEEQQASMKEQVQEVSIPIEKDVTEVEQKSEPVDESSTPKEIPKQDIMTEAMTIKGVKGAMMVSQDGLVSDSQWRTAMDVNEAGAVMSEIWKMVAGEQVQKSFGNVDTVLIETAETTFYMMDNPEGAFVFVTGPAANLGTVRRRLDGLVGNYLEKAGGL